MLFAWLIWNIDTRLCPSVRYVHCVCVCVWCVCVVCVCASCVCECIMCVMCVCVHHVCGVCVCASCVWRVCVCVCVHVCVCMYVHVSLLCYVFCLLWCSSSLHASLLLSSREVRQAMPFSEKDFLTQLHGWWHVLTGLGTYLHILSSSRIRMELLGYSTAVKVCLHAHV